MVANVAGMPRGMEILYEQRLGSTTQPDGIYPTRPSPPPGVGPCTVKRGDIGITYFPRLLPPEGVTDYSFDCLDGERVVARCSVWVEPVP